MEEFIDWVAFVRNCKVCIGLCLEVGIYRLGSIYKKLVLFGWKKRFQWNRWLLLRLAL